MPKALMLSLIPLVVGLLLIAACFISLSRMRTFVSKAQQTQGTIVDMVFSRGSSTSSNASYTYTPVFEFRAMSGQMIRVKESVSSNPPQFQVGETVEVIYDPEAPQGARIHKWSNLYLFPVLFGVMGMIITGIGIAVGYSDAMRLLGF